MQLKSGKIGVFDSGYGGLTIFRSIQKRLPHYDYIYLGDNARAPYGNRSFQTIFEYTLTCVEWLYRQGCRLVILACNTASAKALRSIQQNEMHRFDPDFRVLGVIRPTVEIIHEYSQTNHIGLLATEGTVKSNSYYLELQKYAPEVTLYQHACPMWVPFIESNEHLDATFNHFIQKDIQALLQQSDKIDAILLGCTHYPIIYDQIRVNVPEHIKIIAQGTLVADSLGVYLLKHTEIDASLSTSGTASYFTTDDATMFEQQTLLYFGEKISVQSIKL